MAKKSDWQRNFLICLVLTIVTMVIYAPLRHFSFINYDDQIYVYENPELWNLSFPHSLQWIFTNHNTTDWIPVTWISFMIDCLLWGRNPGMMHLVNVLLHLSNTLLLFWVLKRMTAATWRSAIVAGLFSLHPAHVESVAWISERKDVLSTFFLMLTLLIYIQYTERLNFRSYGFCLCCYALSLSAKSIGVTLPFLLLLLDYWPLHRTPWEKVKNKQNFSLSFLIKEKIPFLILAILVCVLTYWTQLVGGAVVSIKELPLSIRLGNAIVSYLHYIKELFWPFHFSIYYPYAVWLPITVFIAAVFLSAVSVLAIKEWEQKPYFLVGWFWYLGTLVPMIGIVQVGRQAFVDHHTYLPFIGLFIALVWGAADYLSQYSINKVATGVGAVVLLVGCAFLSWRQVQYWQNSETVFQHALEVVKPSRWARGYIVWFSNHTNQNLELLKEPNFTEPYTNLGAALMDEGRLSEAEEAFQKALMIEPDSTATLNSLGTVYLRQEDYSQAEKAYQKAIKLKPGFSDAYANLGEILYKEKKDDEAIVACNNALKFNSRQLFALYTLSNIYWDEEKMPEAEATYRTILQLTPLNQPIRHNLCVVLEKEEKYQEAETELHNALRVSPSNARLHSDLSHLFLLQGKLTESIQEEKIANELMHKIEIRH